MKSINWIMQWARSKGYGAMYGNPAHINRMMHDVDYSSCTDNTAVFCHLITAGETREGHDRSTVGVFFSRLCDFDFDPEGLLTVQEDLQDIAKTMLADMMADNVIGYEDPVRWQYGYDDYADNVAWVCMRVTCTVLAADCVPMPEPKKWQFVNIAGQIADIIEQIGIIVQNVNGLLILPDDYAYLYCVCDHDGAEAVYKNIPSVPEWENLYLHTELITPELAEEMPFMEQYIGWYMVYIEGIRLLPGDNSVEVVVSGGGASLEIGPSDIHIMQVTEVPEYYQYMFPSMGYPNPVIRYWAVTGTDIGGLCVGVSLVLDTQLLGATLHITVNGDDVGIPFSSSLIDAAMVASVPVLAPYEGQYLIDAARAVGYDPGEQNADAWLEDHDGNELWHGYVISWEEE